MTINDAEQFMMVGKYDSAFDRVHTAFHGYLRKILDNKAVEYEVSDTLTQLYTKLHDKVATEIGSPEIAELVKKTMRSSSGAIAAINEMRNRHSLSHPNEYIIDKREAEFAIRIIKNISDYINDIVGNCVICYNNHGFIPMVSVITRLVGRVSLRPLSFIL